MPVNLYEAAWIVLIYAFLGWCAEVAFAAVNSGKFVNRGFLNGPVCPIYGVGMLIVVTALWRLRSNVILLFIGAAVLTSALEFVTGYVLEKFFKEKWWDYSDMPFNIKGYVCLKFSILWGFAATFVIGAVHAFIYMLISKTPIILGFILLAIFAVAFVTDLVITLIEILKIPKKLKAMSELEHLLTLVSDSIGVNISDKTIIAKEKSDELKVKGTEIYEENKPRIDELKSEYERKLSEYKKKFGSRNIVHSRIFTAFPNLKNGKYKAAVDRFTKLRESLAERKQNEKN